MSSNLVKAGIVLVAVVALIYQNYQLWIKDKIEVFGIGREMQVLSDFPYNCRRIQHPDLGACEDMWLDSEARKLYLSCNNDPTTRLQWMPNVGKFNASARSLKESITVLDIDKPNGRSYQISKLSLSGFSGSFHPLSLSVRRKPGMSRLEFWTANNRPTLDAITGKVVDNAKVGADQSVEFFEIDPKTSKLEHVRTFSDPLIATPNNVAPVAGGGFYITNDHGLNKAGFFFELSVFNFGGNVVYCSPASECKVVAKGFSFPNGLIHPPILSSRLGQDILVVPSAALNAKVSIYRIEANHDLTLLDTIAFPYPIDNFSEDSNGDLIAAAFPKMLSVLNGPEHEYVSGVSSPPAAAFRFRIKKMPTSRQEKGEYEITKLIEDGNAEVLPFTTVVINDVKTGRLFMGSVQAPYIAVCEPRV